jgi:hypothetical protein
MGGREEGKGVCVGGGGGGGGGVRSGRKTEGECVYVDRRENRKERTRGNRREREETFTY